MVPVSSKLTVLCGNSVRSFRTHDITDFSLCLRWHRGVSEELRSPHVTSLLIPTILPNLGGAPLLNWDMSDLCIMLYV